VPEESSDQFPILDVAEWPVGGDEQLGTKEKRWLIDPNGQHWLFKRVRGDATGAPRGEDWAEKVAAELAALLHLPVAHVELAAYRGQRGMIGRSFTDQQNDALEHGNELLAGNDPSYDLEEGRENPGYTVTAVSQVLGDVQAPAGWTGPAMSAYDVWSGYLVLDAWIANRDRHHLNWGVVQHADGRRTLAPSYDHGNSLGNQERDPDGLTGNPSRLAKWLRDGKSHHFAGRPPLVDLAASALVVASDPARRYWLEVLTQVDEGDVSTLLGRVPIARMSDPARNLASQILQNNRRRLLDVLG
jgi:hypothetical protein